MEHILLFQDVTPPENFLKYLLWSISILILVIIAIWTLLVHLHRSIIKDKNATIEQLILEVKSEQTEKLKLLGEIRPAIVAMTKISEETLQYIRNVKT